MRPLASRWRKRSSYRLAPGCLCLGPPAIAGVRSKQGAFHIVNGKLMTPICIHHFLVDTVTQAISDEMRTIVDVWPEKRAPKQV
jgi:hypothetical protein